MTNATIQIRTYTDVKVAADSIFKRLGLTMSDGINIFLRQVQIHQGFPFEVRLNQHLLCESKTETVEERLAYIRRMHGKFKECKFSSDRLFEDRQRDKERENAK
jgi:DNA-damage-inducible protein J